MLQEAGNGVDQRIPVAYSQPETREALHDFLASLELVAPRPPLEPPQPPPVQVAFHPTAFGCQCMLHWQMAMQ